MQYLIDVEAESQSFMSEEELFTDGCEKKIGLFIDFLWFHYFRGWPSETIEIVSKIEMEWSCVFSCFDCLVFVVVDPAF